MIYDSHTINYLIIICLVEHYDTKKIESESSDLKRFHRKDAIFCFNVKIAPLIGNQFIFLEGTIL